MNARVCNLWFLAAILICSSQLLCKQAGILPYKIENGITYFLVGYNGIAISDFGGDEYNPTVDRNTADTAARGFNEKTMFMFSNPDTERPDFFPCLKGGTDGGVYGHEILVNIVLLYASPKLAKDCHDAIKKVLEQHKEHQLRLDGYDYTIYIVPIDKMAVLPDGIYTKFEDRRPIALTEKSVLLSKQLKQQADPMLRDNFLEFIWITKENLYEALNLFKKSSKNPHGLAPKIMVKAPLHHQLDRTLRARPHFIPTLASGKNEKGTFGLQAVMP